MITKEELKKEIDKLPDEVVEQLYQLINKLTINGNKKEFKLNAINLGGYFDDKDIRKLAYE